MERLKQCLEVGALLKRGVAMTVEVTAARIGSPSGGVVIGGTDRIVPANILIMGPRAIPLTRIVTDGNLNLDAKPLCHGVLGVYRPVVFRALCI
jgi:hypothetical protein